eukprot:3187696-Rhodomonas_salina.2
MEIKYFIKMRQRPKLRPGAGECIFVGAFRAPPDPVGIPTELENAYPGRELTGQAVFSECVKIGCELTVRFAAQVEISPKPGTNHTAILLARSRSCPLRVIGGLHTRVPGYRTRVLKYSSGIFQECGPVIVVVLI